MLLKRYLPTVYAVCIGLACLAQPIKLVLSAPQDNLVALTPTQIKEKSQFVVRIDRGTGEGSGNGSGFIVNKNGNNYTVLTNEHVVRNSTGQTLVTADGKRYPFTSANIRVISGLDLAEITFTSTQTYSVAKFSSKYNPILGNSIYVYGWNAVDKPIYPVRQGRFASGIVNQMLPIENSYQGYTLVFNLPAVPGLSGSPLWDENGDVIGIYGLTQEDNKSSTLGISISTYQIYANAMRSSSIKPSLGSNVKDRQPRLQATQVSNVDFKLSHSLVGHTSLVYSVAISPDGQTIVSGSEDRSIKIWRLSDGQLLKTLNTDMSGGGYNNSIGAVVISPDGKNIIAGGGGSTIKIWRLSDGQLLKTLIGHTSPISSLLISPNGKNIISGSRDNTIKIWRLSDGQLLQTLSGHTNWINALAISSDGKAIISGSSDNTIKIWRVIP
jgi:S1-C subfamily serine protease